MSSSSAQKISGHEFGLSPSSVETNALSDIGSQRVSGHNFAHASRPSSEMFHASTTSVELPISEKQQQQLLYLDSKTSSTATNVSAAGGGVSMAAPTSTDKSTPPPLSSFSQADTAENAKAKNHNVRRNVYISGIPPVYRSEEFRQLCMQFGRVEAAKLCVDNRSAPTKAYGFALFYSEESAAAAIRGLNGSFLQGRCVQARLADSHATPQPLGDEGSAAKTMIPPSLHHSHRDGRSSNGIHRKGRNNNNNNNINNNRRGAPPAEIGILPSPGIQSGPLTPPYSAIPPGTTLLTPAGVAADLATAIPMDMNAYYQYISIVPSTTSPPPPVTTAPTAMQAASSATSTSATNTRNVSPSNCNPGTDAGFGAVGTPVVGPLSMGMSGPYGPPKSAVAPVLSPVSMALTPPLLSPHSTDSCRSVSPDASRATAANNAPIATKTMGPIPPNMQQIYSTATTTGTAPYQISYQPLQTSPSPSQYQQPILSGAPAGQMAIVTGTGADGTPTFMYYPLPTSNGVNAIPQTALQGVNMPSMQMAKANGGAGQLPGSVMYFTIPQGAGTPVVPQVPQQQLSTPPQSTFLAMPSMAGQAGTMAQNGVPANYVVLDNNNMGMPFQILRPM